MSTWEWAQDRVTELIAAVVRVAVAGERIAAVLEDVSDRERGRVNVGGVVVTREDRP